MKEGKYHTERSDRFELVSLKMNDIALLVSYRKQQVCLFCGGFRRTERANRTMSGTILPCLSRNTLKSVRELVVHTHCAFSSHKARCVAKDPRLSLHTIIRPLTRSLRNKLAVLKIALIS